VKKEPYNHEQIVQYLLGELSEQEKIHLEEHYFGDDDFFEELLVVEGELIDAYVREELYGRKRERFEAHFLASPPKRQRVEIARALVEYATESSVAAPPTAERRKSFFSWQSLLDTLDARNRAIGLAFAAAVLVILFGGSLFVIETVRLRNQLQRIQADRAETLKREQELEQQLADQGQHNDQLADELQRERSQRELLERELTKPQRSTLSSITFVLAPGLVRGASEPKRLTIPPGAALVWMQLYLEQDDYKTYRAVLETVEGNRIWSSGLLKARPTRSSRVVTLGLPASLLNKRGYILILSGVNAEGSLENVGEYYFNVVKN
jgi:hypothetical protein